MSKLDPKHAPRPPEADDLTVQYFVPRELLQQLAAQDDSEEQTLLVLPTEAARGLAAAPARPSSPPPVSASAVLPRVAPPVELPRVAPAAAPVRPMTPVTITDEEVQALFGPRRRARLFGVALLLLMAAGIAAAALASR